MNRKSTKDPKSRRSYGSAELWKKQKKQRNEKRGKQKWVGGSIAQGGHWERMSAEQSESSES